MGALIGILIVVVALISLCSYLVSSAAHKAMVRNGNGQAKAWSVVVFVVCFLAIFASVAYAASNIMFVR